MALYIIYCIYNNIMRKNSSYTDVLLCYFVTFCWWIATWMTAVNILRKGNRDGR